MNIKVQDGKLFIPNGEQEVNPGFNYNSVVFHEVVLPESLITISNRAFEECGSLKRITFPKNLKSVGHRSFCYCSKLQEVQMNEGLKLIGFAAFGNCNSLEHIKLPKSLKEIEPCAFRKCSNLKTIEMSSDLNYVGFNIFEDCKNLETIIIDGKPIKVNEDVILFFDQIYNFLAYAIKNNKFIPKNTFIMTETKQAEISNFYKHSKEWKIVLNNYINGWKSFFSVKPNEDVERILTNLYSVSIMLGLFQDGKNGIMAQDYINKVIIKMHPEVLHRLYSGLHTSKNGYNEEFAHFFIKNSLEANFKDYLFLARVEDGLFVNYIDTAYNNWDKIKLAYPNKTVFAHRETGSENNNLTEQDIINALTISHYENVDIDNQEMAEMVGRYGYTQTEFEHLQNWFNTAKKINQEDCILKVEKDTQEKGITFELLEKNNPEALILGEITNCCQTVGDAGSSCVKYGVTKLNSGFVKFVYNKKIIGQSWVWYNEKTGVVCLDNIEVPTLWQKELQKRKFKDDFMACVKRLANSFKTEMEKSGKKVNMVTVGTGFNDLHNLSELKKVKTGSNALPEDYKGYSDAEDYWYVVLEQQKNADIELSK